MSRNGSVQSKQPRLFDRGGNEPGKKGMRLEGSRFQLGGELHADEPGMVGTLDNLGQQSVRRHAGKDQPLAFKRTAISRIDLIAMAVAFGYLRRTAIDGRDVA